MEMQSTNSKKPVGCLGKGTLFLAGLLIVLALLVFAGVVYEVNAETADSAQYPAPGRLVEVNGRMMHIQCSGSGSPTIILDAGQGGWSTDWTNIIPELNNNNRVCAYDRAGYGWSDSAEDARSPQDAAGDLAALLAAAQIEPPYLLVGFSHAGLANRLFVARHSDDMAGMVLIDPATEFDNEIMSPELMQQQQTAVGMFKGFAFLAKTGLLRLMGPQNMAGKAPFIGTEPADPDIYYTFIADPQWWAASAQEFESGLNEEHMTMVREQGAIPDMPLVIIGSDVLDAGGSVTMEKLQAARYEKLQTLAAQSTQGEFIIAADSSHNIIHDRSDVVVEAVETVLAADR